MESVVDRLDILGIGRDADPQVDMIFIQARASFDVTGASNSGCIYIRVAGLSITPQKFSKFRSFDLLRYLPTWIWTAEKGG